MSYRLSGLSPFLGDDDAETLNNILACRWDLEDQEFQDVSEEAREFISKLLIKEKRRPRAFWAQEVAGGPRGGPGARGPQAERCQQPPQWPLMRLRSRRQSDSCSPPSLLRPGIAVVAGLEWG